jgi:hypothetical protein
LAIFQRLPVCCSTNSSRHDAYLARFAIHYGARAASPRRGHVASDEDLIELVVALLSNVASEWLERSQQRLPTREHGSARHYDRALISELVDDPLDVARLPHPSIALDRCSNLRETGFGTFETVVGHSAPGGVGSRGGQGIAFPRRHGVVIALTKSVG